MSPFGPRVGCSFTNEPALPGGKNLSSLKDAANAHGFIGAQDARRRSHGKKS